MPININTKDAAAFQITLLDTQLIVSRAENVFMFLSRVIEDGDYDGHHGIADMAALAGCALAAFGEQHNEVLAGIGRALRDARLQEDAK